MTNAHTRLLPRILLLLLSLAGSDRLTAQTITVTPGQTIVGRLDAGDLTLRDNSHYDLYLYQGRPGDEIIVTLRSDEFDAYLSGGVLIGTELMVEDSDDDGAGGTDAALTVTVGEDGTYGIRANSLYEGETGAYTLTVERVERRPAHSSGLVTITAGQTIAGELSADDAVLSDGSYYDLYRYEGRPGDEIEITLRSDEFDAYLAGGLLAGKNLMVDDSDDDGAGGTNARLTVVVGADGVYGVRANSLFERETGSYTLTVERIDGSGARDHEGPASSPLEAPGTTERPGSLERDRLDGTVTGT